MAGRLMPDSGPDPLVGDHPKEALERLKRLMHDRRYSERALSEAIVANRVTLREVLKGNLDTEYKLYMLGKALRYLDSHKPISPFNTGIPVYGEIPAGKLRSFEGLAEPESHLSLTDLSPKEHFALRVDGSSMEPICGSGDMVIFKKIEGIGLPEKSEGPTPVQRLLRYDGKIVCAMVDGETTLKRLEIAKTGADDTNYIVTLRPLNPKHPNIVVGPKNTLALQGEAIRIIKEL